MLPKRMQFKIANPEQSEALQKVLFKLGYEWSYNGKNVANTRELYLTAGYFSADPKNITFGTYSKAEEKDMTVMNTEKFIAEYSQCNGVDGDGKPLHFKDVMLQPNMRVKNRKNDMYVVFISNEERKVFVNNDGWYSAAINQEKDCLREFEIVEVYDEPPVYRMSNPDKHGDLLWKRVDNTKKQEAMKELDEAEQALKDAQAKLEQAKQKLESL